MSDDVERVCAGLEAATGPDRELDAKIAVAMSGDAGAWVVGMSEGSIFTHRPGWWRDSSDKSRQAPAYTASLDAAMTLLPEGAGLTISRYWTMDHEGPVWSAEIAQGGVPDDPRRVSDCYDKATPALACCAAALRAHLASRP